jgi:hypothetical protein
MKISRFDKGFVFLKMPDGSETHYRIERISYPDPKVGDVVQFVRAGDDFRIALKEQVEESPAPVFENETSEHVNPEKEKPVHDNVKFVSSSNERNSETDAHLWSAKDGNHTFGPCSLEQLKELIRTSEVHRNFLVKRDDWPDWMTAGDCPGLNSAFMHSEAGMPKRFENTYRNVNRTNPESGLNGEPNDTFAWLYALMPIIGVLVSLLFKGYVPLLINCILELFFWIMDLKDIGIHPFKHFPAWTVWGVFLPPVYLFLRAKKTNHHVSMGVVNLILTTIDLILWGAGILVIGSIISTQPETVTNPVNAELEKSEEELDAANIRSAYADIAADYLTGGAATSKTVELKQKQDGWQNELDLPAIEFSGTPAAGGVAVVSVSDAGNFLVTFQGNADQTSRSSAAVPEETPEASSVQFNYYGMTVSYQRAETVNADYSEKTELDLYFTFTNNSSKNQTFLTSFDVKAYQNGVELDDTYWADTDEKKNDSREIQPGTTVTICDPKYLNDLSPVEVVVTPIFSDEKLLDTTVTLQ